MRNLIVAVLMLITTVSVCSAETANDAVRALKKLEARCQAGISYKDFPPALGDAKFTTNMYLEGSESKKTPELAKLIKNAIGHYKFTYAVWGTKFRLSNNLSIDNKLATLFFDTYPGSKKDSKEGGVIVDGNYNIDRAVNYTMTEASKDIANASKLLENEK
jgi:hypothetical protein